MITKYLTSYDRSYVRWLAMYSPKWLVRALPYSLRRRVNGLVIAAFTIEALENIGKSSSFDEIAEFNADRFGKTPDYWMHVLHAYKADLIKLGIVVPFNEIRSASDSRILH